MEKYSLGWKEWKDLHRHQLQPVSSGSWWGAVRNFILFALIMYLLIGGFSLLGVAFGEDIPYMPFWHEPWRQLFKLIGFLSREVMPNGIPV